MHIKKIRLVNFRCYDDAEFDFNPGFNLVVGINGSGKTSLLRAVAASFKSLATAANKLPLELTDDDARFIVDRNSDRIRFERTYPIEIVVSGNYFDEIEWKTSKDRLDFAVGFDPFLFAANNVFSDIDSTSKKTWPLIAFYRADRRWASTQITTETAATQRDSRLDAYLNWHDAAADLSSFESWIIGKTLERLQRVSRQKQHISHFNDELDLLDLALKTALPGSQGIDYDLDLRTILVRLSEDQSIPFNDLSDGQRSLVALIADISRRMCLLNPHLGNEVLQKTFGTIIIDELDIHLHPTWQRDIVRALKQAFPSMQFIAASHSPQIIGSLKPEEIIVLSNGVGAHPRASYGLDSSSVLEEIMGTSQRLPEVKDKLDEILSILEENDTTLARDKLAKLKETAKDLPEYNRIESLLKRKEIIGR